jgi:regulation of enolase protein 1 (concanavalin A-like superfamily)
MGAGFYWINEPRQWRRDDDLLSVTTDEKTDFWKETWYGFERFSGHFFGADVTGDFSFQVKVRADFKELYDQAGIMLVVDENHWLKAGIEFNDGAPAIGSVLTLQHSDWATGVFPGNASEFWMRLTRKGDALRLQYSADGKIWPLLRLAHSHCRKMRGWCHVLHARTRRPVRDLRRLPADVCPGKGSARSILICLCKLKLSSRVTLKGTHETSGG